MITGKITDKTTHEPLLYANVYVSDINGVITDDNIGTITDEYGNYSLDITSGYVTVSYVGYKSQTKVAMPELNFTLHSTTQMLPEFEVTAKRKVPWWKNKKNVLAIVLSLAIISLIVKIEMLR